MDDDLALLLAALLALVDDTPADAAAHDDLHLLADTAQTLAGVAP
jgi:hypothetical protein